MNTEFFLWLAFFIFALVVEIPIYIYLLRMKVSWIRAGFAGALASTITHPVLWFVVQDLFESYILFMLLGEAAVVLVEATIIYIVARPATFRISLVASLGANMASLLGGFLIQGLILLFVQ